MNRLMKISLIVMFSCLIALPAFAQGGRPPGDVLPKDQRRLKLVEKMKESEEKKADSRAPEKPHPDERPVQAEVPDAGAARAPVDLEKEMDKHRRRLAQIYRIESIAKETRNTKLLEKVMLIRQKELRRHIKMMSRAREVAADAGRD